MQILSGVRSSWHTGGEKTLENYRRQIDTVAQVGSRILVMHAANLSLDGPDPDFDFADQVLDYAPASTRSKSRWKTPLRASRMKIPHCGICPF